MIRSVAALVLTGLLVAEAAAAIVLFIHAPRQGEAVFGPTEVEIEVLSSVAVAAVEVSLDGELVATLSEPPYRVSVDFGQENRPHTLTVTATDVEGGRETETVITGAVRVDERVELGLQQLYVTVTRDRERVAGLARDRFQILDRGGPQRIVTFEGGDVPLTAVLMVDSSLSMKGDALGAALAGARAFIAAMGELDEAKVMVFSDRLLAATDFTGDPEEVGAVMGGVEPSGSTAIHDHLFLALKELEPRQGRKVIILLSDGLDIDSALPMSAVEWKAGRVQSVVYWIRPTFGADLDRDHSSVWRSATAQQRQILALRQTVEISGGRVVELDGIERATSAFAEVLSELRGQYVLGYYPTIDLDDGAWHEVEVRVDAPGVRARTRTGYYDDER